MLNINNEKEARNCHFSMSSSVEKSYEAEDDEKIRLLQEALELDPNYALAWAYLSRTWGGLAFATDSSQEYDKLVAEAQKAAEEALRLDPTLAASHNAMGWVAHRKGENLEAPRS